MPKITYKLLLNMLDTINSIPSSNPCHEVNPRLWELYCEAVGRYPWPAPDWWTEADVVQACDNIITKYFEAMNNECEPTA
jgi:hypothetical protein